MQISFGNHQSLRSPPAIACQSNRPFPKIEMISRGPEGRFCILYIRAEEFNLPLVRLPLVYFIVPRERTNEYGNPRSQEMALAPGPNIQATSVASSPRRRIGRGDKRHIHPWPRRCGASVLHDG